MPRCSQRPWPYLLLPRTKGRGVPEPRLVCFADLASGQGSATDARVHCSCMAPHEPPGGCQGGHLSWVHPVEKQCPFLGLRTTTGEARRGSRGVLAGTPSLRALPGMNQHSSGFCCFLKRLMLGRERARAE